MIAPDSLLQDVESMKHMLMSAACGGDRTDPAYTGLRLKLIKTPLRDRLPRFVHTCRDLGEFWAFISPKFGTYRERRAFLAEAFDLLLSDLEQGGSAPAHDPIHQALAKVDSAHVHEVWQKALDRRHNDPEGAITAARTLLESVCKHILMACGVSFDEGMDLPKLHALAIKQLNLAPSQHTELLFKTILGNCQSIVNALGTLRNKLGDAHGKGPRQVKPAPRHAELAVNLAGTMAAFLLATWEIKEPVLSLSKGLSALQRELLKIASSRGGFVQLERVNTDSGQFLSLVGLPGFPDPGTSTQDLINRGLLELEPNGRPLTFPLTQLGTDVAKLL